MKVNDIVQLKFGPFQATGVVVEIKPAGAVVQVQDDATLVGYDTYRMRAPNGDYLTNRPSETFIGRALWRPAPEHHVYGRGT